MPPYPLQHTLLTPHLAPRTSHLTQAKRQLPPHEEEWYYFNEVNRGSIYTGSHHAGHPRLHHHPHRPPLGLQCLLCRLNADVGTNVVQYKSATDHSATLGAGTLLRAAAQGAKDIVVELDVLSGSVSSNITFIDAAGNDVRVGTSSAVPSRA